MHGHLGQHECSQTEGFDMKFWQTVAERAAADRQFCEALELEFLDDLSTAELRRVQEIVEKIIWDRYWN